jgi:secreted trypsin-like serine protease
MLQIMKKFLLIRVIILLIISIEGDALSYECDKNIVPCGCGQTSVGINARIVNGENAIPNSWAMMVSLTENRESPRHSCGGTILSESYILTAAHCVDMFSDDLSFENLTITAGIFNLSQPDRISRQVDKISIHPLWKEFHEDLQYDIAILHLAKPLDLEKNSSITRTCLPPRSNTLEEMMQYPLNGTSLVVIGWGRLSTSGPVPDILQQVTVNSIHHFDKICANSIRDPSIQFCAGLYEGAKSEK